MTDFTEFIEIIEHDYCNDTDHVTVLTSYPNIPDMRLRRLYLIAFSCAHWHPSRHTHVGSGEEPLCLGGWNCLDCPVTIRGRKCVHIKHPYHKWEVANFHGLDIQDNRRTAGRTARIIYKILYKVYTREYKEYFSEK